MNGNPLYTETPANRTLGNNKDTGGRGKGRSNESNPNSNTSNNKGQGGKKGGGGKSFGGRGRGKGVNAVEAGENGLTKDKYRTCSRTSKKNGNREANLTQFPTLGLSGRKQSSSG